MQFIIPEQVLLLKNERVDEYRRLRGDMIEVFKITHDIYDLDVSL